MRTLFFLFSLPLFASTALAQDLHFSQYHLLPTGPSPALTGVMSGNVRLTANARQQWSSLAGNEAWRQAYFAFDSRFCTKGGFLAFGLHLQGDRMGQPTFSNTWLSANVAYHKQLDRGLFLSGGVSAGVLEYKLDLDGLTFDEQFGKNGFDPMQESFEHFEADQRRVFDLSAGVLLFSHEQNWTLGAAIHHATRPNYSFFADSDNELGIGLSLHGSVTTVLTPSAQRNRLTIRGHYRRQSFTQNGRQWQLLTGITWRPFQEKKFKGYDVGLGLASRIGSHAKGQPVLLDAIIPAIYLDLQNLTLGLSYDINTSSAGRNYRFATGAIEATIIYQFVQESKCVTCPRQ